MRPVTARSGDCSRLSASASNLLAAGSEIAAGRIALFSRAAETAWNGFCCSRVRKRANLDCRRPKAPPWLSPGTLALCSSDFPLDPERSSDRPSLTLRSVVKVSNETRVPKGRLELPWIAPLRPERSASAISPLRHGCGSHPAARSRPGDSNPGPAVYETAALPTELGRQIGRAHV